MQVSILVWIICCFPFIKSLLFCVCVWGGGCEGGTYKGFVFEWHGVFIYFFKDLGLGFKVSRFDGIGPNFQHDLRHHKTQGIPKVLCIFQESIKKHSGLKMWVRFLIECLQLSPKIAS